MDTSLKTFERPLPASEFSSEPNGSSDLNDLKFRNLAEYIAQPVWVAGPNGYGEYFNAHWTSYTGLSEEESSDFGWSRAVHAEDLGNFMKLFRNSVRSTAWEYEEIGRAHV